MGVERDAFKGGARKNAFGTRAPRPLAADEPEGLLAGRFLTYGRDYGSGASLVRRVTFACAGVLGVAAMAAAALYGAILGAAPTIDPHADLYALNRPGALTFLDRNGDVAGHSGAAVGERLRLSEMPGYLPAAFLAMEDRDFYHHPGIDPRGIVRAAIADLKAGAPVQGGSTITQQLVKMLFLTPQRTIWRKLSEIGGAFELERLLGKKRILALYLNRIYLGAGAYGVDGAARIYFGKSARDVTLAEAAMLAGLTRAPSAYSPYRDPAAARARADLVLDAMVQTGAITKAEAAAARAHPAKVVARGEDFARAYFFDAASDAVHRLLPSATGDLIVRTTFDPDLQDAARAAVDTVLAKRGKAMKAGQAALVSMSVDGAVRAMVGGRDYAASPFNRATDAHRQPGSAFKPFVYLAALESGLTPYDVRNDAPVSIDGYAPENYGHERWGDVTLNTALVHSINTIAVKVENEVGVNKVIAVAKKLGITSPLEPNASLALGTSEVTPLELTGAYGAFASGGLRVRPYLVTAIARPGGTVLYRRETPTPQRAMTHERAETMNAMLYDVVESGTGRRAAVTGHEVAGKTGTSADFRDAWFVGFSARTVTGVWVGNDDFTPMKRVTGGSLPAEIWSTYMTAALKNVPPAPLDKAMPPPPVETAAYYVSGDPDQSPANGYYIDPGPDQDLPPRATRPVPYDRYGGRYRGDPYAGRDGRDPYAAQADTNDPYARSTPWGTFPSFADERRRAPAPYPPPPPGGHDPYARGYGAQGNGRGAYRPPAGGHDPYAAQGY